MRKPLVVLAAVIAFLCSGGVALALTTGDRAQAPASTESNSTESSTESASTDSTETETDESESSDSDEPDTESSESEAPESEAPDDEAEGQKDKNSTGEHPDNHGAEVSKAAHECPKGPGHGECVSAVAHKHD